MVRLEEPELAPLVCINQRGTKFGLLSSSAFSREHTILTNRNHLEVTGIESKAS
jgi:hypothetical protein